MKLRCKLLAKLEIDAPSRNSIWGRFLAIGGGGAIFWEAVLVLVVVRGMASL